LNSIESRSAEEKKRINSISAPPELEARLRDSLHTIPPKKKRKVHVWKLAAVSLFFLALAGYQYNALAYYGKKLLGFDEVMNGTLHELNQKGMGQIIEKNTQLADGTDLTINGLMADENQLIIYYTLRNSKGLSDNSWELFQPSRMTGFLTNAWAESGSAVMNEDHTEIKGTMFFEPVSPFSKKLKLKFSQTLQNEVMKVDEIFIHYNPNKAMKTMLKQSIKKTVKVDKGTITFDSITASPTATVINGTLDVENFDRFDFALEGVQLLANGMPVESMGGGSKSSLRGMEFDIRFDALPKKLDSLELVVKKFAGYQSLKKNIPLTAMDTDPISLNGKKLWVKERSKTSEGIEITIATADDITLDGVLIETKNGEIPLETTIRQTYVEDDVDRLLKERTLLFDTLEEPEYLLIEGMHYMKAYNEKIEIPID